MIHLLWNPIEYLSEFGRCTLLLLNGRDLETMSFPVQSSSKDNSPGSACSHHLDLDNSPDSSLDNLPGSA